MDRQVSERAGGRAVRRWADGQVLTDRRRVDGWGVVPNLVPTVFLS